MQQYLYTESDKQVTGKPCGKVAQLAKCLYVKRKALDSSLSCAIFWVRSFTGMDKNGHSYRNGLPEWTLCYVFGALHVFYLHKMFLCSHMNCLHKIKFTLV